MSLFVLDEFATLKGWDKLRPLFRLSLGLDSKAMLTILCDCGNQGARVATRDATGSEVRRAALVEAIRNRKVGKTTALYTYLDRTLRSPRLRRMLEEAAEGPSQVAEDRVAR